jgi:hypothetical protein
MKRQLLAAMLLLTALASNVSAGDTVLQGYWEANLGGSRVNDSHPWDLWRPSQYFELKTLRQLGDEAEAWVKFGARWDGWNNPGDQSRFWLQEGHLKYRFDRNGTGFESFLFTRESRYWIGNHLLQLVNDGAVNDGSNAQGLRVDGWRGKWNATYVLSDFSAQDDHTTPGLEPTDDVHIMRVTRRLDERGSYLGGAFLRKNYGAANGDWGKQQNRVFSLDMQWFSDAFDVAAEFADSRVPAEDSADDSWHEDAWVRGDFGQSFERFFPRNSAFRAELRNLKMGDHRWGHYTMNMGYWNIGPDYRNYQGGDTTDRVGHFFNTYYRLPQRAVTYSLDWGRERRRDNYAWAFDFEGEPTAITRDPRRWLNQNIYVEFINGFKVSLAHNRSEDFFFGRTYEHNDWLAELIVENRLAWLKTQFKIKDWETEVEKRIFGLETSLRITDSLKWYNRYMVANDSVESRHMLYTQIQYRPHDNTELFLAYGPDWFGDWGHLTNDSDFETGGRMVDEFKFQLKTWF